MEQLFKTDTQKTPLQRSRDCRAEMERLTADDAKWGQRTVGSQVWTQLKVAALEVARAGNAPDASEEDQAGADAALAIAELAQEKATAAAGRRTQPSDPSDPFGSAPRSAHNPARGWQPRRVLAATEIDGLPDGGFNSFAEYLRAIGDAHQGRGFDSRLTQFKATQGRSSDGAGGFLVPERFDATLIQTADEQAPWLKLRRSFDLTGPGEGWTMPALADRDRSTSTIAGLKLRRTTEGTTIDDDTLTFESRKLSLSAAKGLVYVTAELMTDSAVGVDRVLTEAFARAIALLQSTDYLRGSGAGEPLGLLNASAGSTYTIDAEGDQAADTIVYENVAKMRARCWGYSNAIWLYHPSALPQLMQMTLPVGTSGVAMWQTNAADGEPDRLVGRPAYATEACSLLGDVGDIVLTVPSEYGYLSRPVRIDSSAHVGFDQDVLAFKCVVRDAGMPLQGDTRLDLQGFEQSETITLAARA